MERVVRKLEHIRKRFRPDSAYFLEYEVNRFISNLTPGTVEKLLETPDSSLKMYHYGEEKRVVPGLPARDIPTGNEYVFLEYKNPDGIFHMVGSVDRETGKFLLKELDKAGNKGYKKVSMNKHKEIIKEATAILRNLNPDSINT